jgi:hypothetical protein
MCDASQVDLVPTQVHQLGRAEAVAVGHEDHGRVAAAVSVALRIILRRRSIHERPSPSHVRHSNIVMNLKATQWQHVANYRHIA